jgi:hypothetical protein
LLYWVSPLLAFIFFILFGVTDDAIRGYASWYDQAKLKLFPHLAHP